MCNKVFSDPSNFAKHQRIHSAEQKIETLAETEQSMEEYLLTDTINNDDVVDDNLICDDAELSNTNTNTIDETARTEQLDVEEGSGSYITAERPPSSLVQILNSDDLTFRTLAQDDEAEQVIYVYSGPGGPLFTFDLPDEPSHSQQQEVY